MSDPRTEAIHKLSTELVQELLNTTKATGGERWFHVIARKMEQVPDRAPLKVDTSSRMLRIGSYLLSKLGEKIVVNRFFRNSIQPGGDDAHEVDRWDAKDIAKLKLWLNGE